ncbi:type II toxin-antitoxin system HicA family toxin [Patescibacteria group bacterium]|nr:type II toxin-antitoxin system HicA family toxin [Patescibacteria group bacterium]MBU0879474.1 type II toxin-antitoxin system HicA family toxin [Patescibacteria group bacterium]MBU0880494.1 type II toxin-antitoxin system HicA family toxin [Patescibacteria group bacterium]MBU1062805.1 type II toxin-antitoxin system HicA family toxin [Patescibacteria group bacterium]MBU1783273.1 type II toxin-antitoxin system HicA family toxin [Patescibacteria group bacterium]
MLKPYLLRVVLKVLLDKGFFFVSQNGSHAKYRCHHNPSLTVIIPIHGKEIQYGTFRSILRQAKLNEDDFRKK